MNIEHTYEIGSALVTVPEMPDVESSFAPVSMAFPFPVTKEGPQYIRVVGYLFAGKFIVREVQDMNGTAFRLSAAVLSNIARRARDMVNRGYARN